MSSPNLAQSRKRISSQMNKAYVLGLAMMMIVALSSLLAMAAPEGPTVTYINNQTNTPDAATVINTTGGSITTITLSATTQNIRWKAYVGNVSGTMTLEDASGSTIYNWATTYPNGEVYATRKETTVSWTNIACANLSHIENENRAINHTNLEDNITATFSSVVHDIFYVGTSAITSNSCRSVHTYVNSTAQSSLFEEVLLYDGTDDTNGNIVYASLLENNIYGFNNKTYDFQMIIPENGQLGWSSSTAYYFYVELS